MAKDADDNYYYEEGTIAEQFDEWDVYEDSDGNVGFLKSGNEIRIHEAGHVFGDTRGAPDSDELGDGEQMLYLSDGSDAASDGDLVLASSDGSTVSLSTVDTTAL